MNTILEVSKLSCFVGEIELLSSVSFCLEKGESVALIGKNGAGKTTLLNCLTGYYCKTNGNVKWKGKSIEDTTAKELAEIVSYCGNAPNPFYNCKVLDMILFGRSLYADFWGNYSEKDINLAYKYSEMFELNSLLERNYTDLSLGEMQRVNLAMTMVAEAEILLLDEPTSHLDPYYQKKLVSNLCRMCSEKKIGILAVLHNISHARYFDRVIVLNKKTITHKGKPSEILVEEILNSIYGDNVFKTVVFEDEKMSYLNV